MEGYRVQVERGCQRKVGALARLEAAERSRTDSREKEKKKRIGGKDKAVDSVDQKQLAERVLTLAIY